MNTTHPFGHFRFADFRERWHKYANPCAAEYFRSEILKLFPLSGRFSPNTDVFGSFGELWGSIT